MVEIMECKYCRKLCKNHNSLTNHERLCKLNPNRQFSQFNVYNQNVKLGIITKENTNQFVKAKLNGKHIEVGDATKLKISKTLKGRLHSQERKNNISKAMIKAVRENPHSYSINNVSGRTPIIDYNGFRLKGSWELQTAKWLDRNNIKWTNSITGFDYEWNGSTHIYYPDFYLIDYDKYIEVKGYQRDRDLAKWFVVKNLIVLKKDEINKIKNDCFRFESLWANYNSK